MPSESLAARPCGFLASLRVQFSVIGALTIRDAMSRYGHEGLGFFWVMGEPLILSAGVMVMWAMTEEAAAMKIGVIPFALSGYTLITLWRHIVQKSVHGMRQNAGLVFHANVKFLDILIARALIEVMGILTAFFIAYIPFTLVGVMDPMRDPLVLFGGFFFMAWFSFGFGLILAGLTELNETLERFVSPVMYVTLPLTGLFYMVDWLPQKFRDILLWSPLVHVFEMFRCGLFSADIPTEWDAMYVFWWCLGLTAVGLVIARYAQRHVRFE
ncbi:MAG: ABC transporter permease [Beijerinckiaceae bacterium]